MKQKIKSNRAFATVKDIDFSSSSLGSGPFIPAGSTGMVQVAHRDGTSQVLFNQFGLRRISNDLIKNIS